MPMNHERGGDLLISQGQFVFIQDGASGLVSVAKGPHKESLAETDKTVLYDAEEMQFYRESPKEAVQVCPTAKEGQYIILHNPSYDQGKLFFPTKGKTSVNKLDIGHKINVQGPITFALFPEQVAEVVDGHQLKSNEYLIVRVYNDEQAKKNLETAVVKTTGDSEKKPKSLFNKVDIDTGKLFIIKGTDVSFFIPPTGFEVLPDSNGNYIRNAVTLERLEYAILLDENGDKDYSFGPKVVFPKPTQHFVEKNGNKKFRAIELNDDMGIYVKVIADYKDGNKEIKAGEELFITGAEQKIYFPRAEHAIIKYGKRTKHYAIVIPKGEARYVLNKEKGTIDLVKGPKTFLPDPRKEVIVKRILDPKTCELWFPGNREALAYNQTLEQEYLEYKGTDVGAAGFLGEDMLKKGRRTKGFESNRYTQAMVNSIANYSGDEDKSLLSADEFVAEEMSRGTTFTKPRQITLDTKYDGAIVINVWPGYAVQIVKKTGERRVVEGPKVELLEFDETLERLELSTGTPKSDDRILRTVYLQVKNNKVSDIIDAETKDLVEVELTLSYRVNFDETHKKDWFSVPNYIKLMTEHIRSLIRNHLKKISIEEFNEKGTDIIRDLILGEIKNGKRTGRKFDENGMSIYDVEVLDIEIGDHTVNELLRKAQKQTIIDNITLQQNQKKLVMTEKTEEVTRKIMDESDKTDKKRHEKALKEIDYQKEKRDKEVKNDVALQVELDKIAKAKLLRHKEEEDENTRIMKERSDIEVKAIVDKAKAIDQKLVEAITIASGVDTTRILAENLKSESGLSTLLQKGGIQGLLDTVKGTPLESQILNVLDKMGKKYPKSK